MGFLSVVTAAGRTVSSPSIITLSRIVAKDSSSIEGVTSSASGLRFVVATFIPSASGIARFSSA